MVHGYRFHHSLVSDWANLKRLLRYRYLISSLVSHNLKARYQGSLLGFLWSFLNPLLLMLVYTLVFSVYMRIEMDNYAAYLFCGLLPWIWFSSALTEGVNSLIQGNTLLSKVPFPPEILPTVPVITHLVNFLLGLLILFIFLYLFHIYPGTALLLLPFLIGLQFIFTLGLSLISSVLNVFFRDIQYILTNLLNLWFFLCPVIYPLDMVPDKFRLLLLLNPMALLIIAYQDVLFYHRYPDPFHLMALSLVSLILFGLAYNFFGRYRKSLIEEI